MRIKTKLYLYDSTQKENDYRGTDLSPYVLQGDSYTEDISDVLEVAEITLAGYPLREKFEPTTKLIYEKWSVQEFTAEDGTTFENEELVYTYDLMVDDDTVNQPILTDENYFDHHISFYDPSVVAQQRLVDNISATYKLKDVNLRELVQFDINRESVTNKVPSYFNGYFGNYSSGFFGWYSNNLFGKHFEFEGNVEMVSLQEGQGASIKQYQNIDNYLTSEGYKAQFNIPKIKIMFGREDTSGGQFNYIGDASLTYTIQEYNLNNLYEPTNTWSGDIISNSNLSVGGSTDYSLSQETTIGDYMKDFVNGLKPEWLKEYGAYSRPAGNLEYNSYFKKYTDVTAPTPSYVTPIIPIQNNKHYTITIQLKNFNDSVYRGDAGNNVYVRNTNSTYKYSRTKIGIVDFNPISERTAFPNNQLIATCSFQTYSSASTKVLYQNAQPYSALTLLQKAIINSATVEKQDGVYIGDINQMNVPFYIDPNFVDELSFTPIVETFFSQKNLWEIMLEVGKYIHSVPRLVFGRLTPDIPTDPTTQIPLIDTEDKFMITFDRLGSADEKTSLNTKMNIMNFRGVEDYISSCSSYVTNMVQLGGTIEEWVAPKTDNPEFLVYNDTCSIVVSKPIIELIDIQVKCTNPSEYSFVPAGNDTANMTELVFEENVYKVLSESVADIPNKGVSLYYKLRDDKIIGCNYRTPTANSGEAQNDYAIKKVIWCAFQGEIPDDFVTTSGWRDIKVNDFIFKVVYRTQDSVRQNQTRPDLRKYLLNSKWDRVPQHNQFNNQTDVVVDSVKFGNNVYGKLIRSGNNSYRVVEWTDNLNNLKHKGELYRLKTDNDTDELYYVVKAKHTFYHSYVVSEVEYSKDYNQLSPIIGIPSEPRFYEISEQSSITRDVSISDYLLLTDDSSKIDVFNTYLKDIGHLARIMFGSNIETLNAKFSKYAITTFKADKNTDVTLNSSGDEDFYVDILTPINAYSSQNTLTYEWNMVDNLSAGDKVLGPAYANGNTADDAYRPMRAVQYTDIFGKASLMDFYIIKDIEELNPDDIRNMPESPVGTRCNADGTSYEADKIGLNSLVTVNGSQRPFYREIMATNINSTIDTDYYGKGIGLLKDCREVIRINYNEELLTSSDTFVISPFVFTPEKQKAKIVLLNKEVNKLSSGYFDTSDIITPFDESGNQFASPYFNLQYTLSAYNPTFIIPNGEAGGALRININIGTNNLSSEDQNLLPTVNENHFGDANGNDVSGFERVKAIAIVYDIVDQTEEQNIGKEIPYKTKFVVAKNIPNLPAFYGKENALKDWYVGSPNNDILFTKKQ